MKLYSISMHIYNGDGLKDRRRYISVPVSCSIIILIFIKKINEIVNKNACRTASISVKKFMKKCEKMLDIDCAV